MPEWLSEREIWCDYRGEGRLIFAPGSELSCEFRAVQARDGSIFVRCSRDPLLPHAARMAFVPAHRLEGATVDGKAFQACGTLHVLDSHDDSDGKVSVVFGCDELTLGENHSAARHRFAITNFHFTGTDHRDHNLVYELTLQSPYGTRKGLIRRVPDYDSVVRRVRTRKTTDVTAEFVIDDAVSSSEAEELATALCDILCVARGTTVQYIAHEQIGPDNTLLKRRHAERITKPYCPLPAIDWRASGRKDTKRFIEMAFPLYFARREALQLHRGTIAAYLDAKAEADFIEMRGVKAAVAMEILKNVHLKASVETADLEFCVPPTLFATCVPMLRQVINDTLKVAGVARREREKIAQAAKIGGLNRSTFRETLRALIRDYEVPIADDELQLFVRCRNSLVHTGDFYCQTASDADRVDVQPKEDAWSEYCFVINILDRVFLKVLGYSGAYVDNHHASVIHLA